MAPCAIPLCYMNMRRSIHEYAVEDTSSEALSWFRAPYFYVSPVASPAFEHQITSSRALLFVRACA